MTEAERPGSARNLIGSILVRVIVPLWVLTGAIFKLIEANPALLPRTTILRYSQRFARALEIELNLDLLLATLISLEFLAIAVMVFLARFARPMAIFLLSVFCLILIGEIANGNSSCGCLGAYSPNPWTMLVIDGALLLGVLLFKPLPPLRLERSSWPAVAAAAFLAVTSFTSFAVLTTDRDRSQEVAIDEDDEADDGDAVEAIEQPGQPDGEQAAAGPAPRQPTSAGPPSPPGQQSGYPADRANPDPRKLPKHWFEGDFSTWEGKPWREIDLFQFMKTWPKGLDEGTRYVVFYSRTCDHCYEMFHLDLAPNAELARQVSAVRVPDDVGDWNLGDPWEMPETEVEHLELPMGTNWIMTTPVSLRVEDGVVRCVEEGGHARCLELE